MWGQFFEGEFGLAPALIGRRREDSSVVGESPSAAKAAINCARSTAPFEAAPLQSRESFQSSEAFQNGESIQDGESFQNRRPLDRARLQFALQARRRGRRKRNGEAFQNCACLAEHFKRGLRFACAFVLMLVSVAGAAGKSSKSQPVTVPELELEGGRKLTYERAFMAEPDVRLKRGFWSKLVDIVIGAPEFHAMINPYEVVTDSAGRIIVTDPGAAGVHIFDFEKQKYKFLSRENDENGLEVPQCVAVDAADNIYVTDSETGKIFVFEPSGKFKRTIGSLKGGEGYFKRPTGIAVDSAAKRIYVTDTLRDQIFVLDMQGNVLQTIGKKGMGEAEFNYPTELRLSGDDLFVVDVMNFRVQALDRSGNFHFAVGRIGDSQGTMFRPKGIGVDSEKHLYVVEAVRGLVQVFDEQGRLLYYFGQKGSGFGEFQLPAGLWIDRNDRVLVVDSYNRRVQVFHYFGLPKQAGGAH